MRKKIIIGSAQFYRKYGIENSKVVGTDDIKKIFKTMSNNSIDLIDTANSYDNNKKLGIEVKKNSNLEYIFKLNSENNKTYMQTIDAAVNYFGQYPNIILAHSPNLYCDKKFIKTCIFLKKHKKINKFGASIYDKKDLNLILNHFIPDVLQIPINLINKDFLEIELLESLKNKNIEIHVRSIFLQGLLFLPKSDIISKFPGIEFQINSLEKIALDLGITLPQLSLIWIYNQKLIDAIVIGIHSNKQLNEHLLLIEKLSLNKEIFKIIDDQIKNIEFSNMKIKDPRKW